jgi:hypothetical protein
VKPKVPVNPPPQAEVAARETSKVKLKVPVNPSSRSSGGGEVVDDGEGHVEPHKPK